jgi:cyanophycin synthetase
MLEHLHTNQKLLISELVSRGASIRLVDLDEELVEVSFNGKKEFLLDRFSSQAPYHVVKLSADKHLAKQLMREQGINVPQGGVFRLQFLQEALDYAKNLYPVVLKPNWGSHGNFIQTDLRDETALKHAILHYGQLRKNEPFIIEQFFKGHEHRLFITRLGGFAVIRRDPAKVIGDGMHSILQLITLENERRIHLRNQSYTSLCPLVLDKEVDTYLALQYGLTHQPLEHIPLAGETVYLRGQSNLAKGGISEDMTDKVHSDIKAIAQRALNSFPGLPMAGFDLLCEDASQPLSSNNYVILEANSNPGIAMHVYPVLGQSRNVPALVADVMFPGFFD